MDAVLDIDVLPNLVVVGAMKCGTTAMHRYLGTHPEIAMSDPKELNFFFGPDSPDEGALTGNRRWCQGNWHRGAAWYARHFPAGAPVRGESSPGYTSPSHPDVAARMAGLIPGARLVYLVRDPIERALSQYRHHRADGDEFRPLEEALLDPHSQYLARSRYHERLAPFLERFARGQIFIAAQEELLAGPPNLLRSLFAFVGVDDTFRPSNLQERSRWARTDLPERLRRHLAGALRDDADCARALAGREFPGWSV